MSKHQPSNSVLLEKINNIEKQVGKIEAHLSTLNGTVGKTKGDVRLIKSLYTFIVPVLTLIIGFLANALFT